jgi:hypothetical protein
MPLFGRLAGEVAQMKALVAPMFASTRERVKRISALFVESVDRRFQPVIDSNFVKVSEFLDPDVAVRMDKSRFLEAKEILESMLPQSAAADAGSDSEGDMFEQASYVVDKVLALDPGRREIQQYIDDLKKWKEGGKLMPSIDWWSQYGKNKPILRRIYMNLASVPLGSIPAEAVFNRLKLMLTDRRASLSDERAHLLTTCNQVLRMELDALSELPPSINEMTEDEVGKLQDMLDIMYARETEGEEVADDGDAEESD